MPDVRIEPLRQPIDVTLAPPGSKSLTNRALVLAALANGECELSNTLFADDTAVMIDGLRKLGFDVKVNDAERRIGIHGRGGEIPARAAELFCGNSGTTIRFLTALVALGAGSYVLDGVPRMRERPIGPLVTILRNLGARVAHLENAGFPPVRVDADMFAGGYARYGSETSSQYLSAVLQVAPYARHEVRIDLDGKQTSWPYVAMTLRLMDEFGHVTELERDPETAEPTRVIVPRGTYAATNYAVEPDASNATYLLALGAVHPGSRVLVPGLTKASLQGDVGFADVLRQMGAAVEHTKNGVVVTGPTKLRAVDIDLSTMPDTAQTLAVVALFADGETTIRGLHTLRVKETDRLAALKNELTKLGATVAIDGDDALTITPPRSLKPADIATYDDHRMAMSFALAATKSAGVTIRDAQCVNKTYPGYFDDLRRAGLVVN
jgi:3-phosphoshikimate 1-carboxyvinyltransferase